MNMTVKQISVFLENKSGQLAEFTKTLSDNNIDMRTLSIAETAEFGIVRVIVNDPDKTISLLKEAGYICAITHVIGVVVPDIPEASTAYLLYSKKTTSTWNTPTLLPQKRKTERTQYFTSAKKTH